MINPDLYNIDGTLSASRQVLEKIYIYIYIYVCMSCVHVYFEHVDFIPDHHSNGNIKKLFKSYSYFSSSEFLFL